MDVIKSQKFTPTINQASIKMAEKVKNKEKKDLSKIDWLRRPA